MGIEKDKMNVLLVSTSAIETPPKKYGGMEREVAWLAQGLRDLGHQVTVLCKTESTIPEPKAWGDNEQDFVEKAQNVEFDIIMDFSHDKLVARSFPNRPQINTYQVMTVGWNKNPVFISKAQRHYINRSAPVIYYGLDANEYPFYEGERERYILYMGSLIREKRVHWVGELSKKLDIPAKIAGPGWQPEYWPILEKMKEDPNIEFVGDVGGEEKLELLQKATCLVHPVGDYDWVEAGAIVVLEALAVGTPVIASTNGCLPEYIVDFHNGFTCQSVDEMVTVFDWLDQVNRHHCRSIINYYNHHRMAADYEKLAVEVIHHGREW